jgi:hypothetical protein
MSLARWKTFPRHRAAGPSIYTELAGFVLHRFPFSVVYLDDPELITIIGVAHSERKPGYWKGRL